MPTQKIVAPPAPKVRPSPEFQLRLGPNLRGSYIMMMNQIYREIAFQLRAENEKIPKSQRIPLRVGGKLFTPKDGTFIVHVIPEDPMEQVLSLLFRFHDLYFESYHFDGVWYRLKDFEADLPPKAQLPYTHEVILSRISSRYADLGVYPSLGPPAFHMCYCVLSQTAELYMTQSGRAILQSGPLAIPSVGISEAVRFWIHERWIKGVLKGVKNVPIPHTISMYFTEWGDLSTAMYKKEVPIECKLRLANVQSRMGILKRRNVTEVPRSGRGDEDPPAVIYGWNDEDNKRLLHAAISVHKMEDTVRYYQTCFGMKLLREEDRAEGQKEVVMGFGTERKSFVLQMINGGEADKYDPKNAFGHFSIAHENVPDIVENGGVISRDPRPDKKEPAISARAVDPCNYRFKLLQRVPTPELICQLTLHVRNMDRAISFYEKALGMRVLTRNDKLQGKNSFAWMGYKDSGQTTVLEFNCKHGAQRPNDGKGYRKLTIGTNNVRRTTEAVKLAIRDFGGSVIEEPGIIPVVRVPVMTFEDPEGWTVMVVEKNDFLKEARESEVMEVKL